MNCQSCEQKPASVHVTEIEKFMGPGAAENEVSERHVCAECAVKLDLPHAPAMHQSVADNIWKLLQLSAQKARAQARSMRCPDCGISLEELRRHGRVGCAGCYDVFADYLAELLERMHGAQEHVGRLPGIGEGELERLQRVTSLKGELDLAIRKEDYEHAAAIRDELKLLETDLEADLEPS